MVLGIPPRNAYTFLIFKTKQVLSKELLEFRTSSHFDLQETNVTELVTKYIHVYVWSRLLYKSDALKRVYNFSQVFCFMIP